MLIWPLWNHPKTASRAAVQSREFWLFPDESSPVRHTVEQANPLNGPGSGLLQWLDLDCLLALSHGALSAGKAELEIAQADALRWMGYDNLLCAPYDTLRSSIGRLQNMNIAHWVGKERPFAGSEHLDVVRLLDKASIRQERGHNVISFRLSSWWTDALANGHWQTVDLDAYAYLVRRHRRDGYVRLLFCYLAAFRTRTGTASVRWKQIDWALSPRKPDGKGRRYRHLKNPNNPIQKALSVLLRTGLIQELGSDDDWCRVAVHTDHIQRLSALGIQTYITGTNPMVTALAQVPSAIPRSPQADLDPGTNPPVLPPPAAGPLVEPPLVIPLTLPHMIRHCHVADDRIHASIEAGWRDEQIARVLGVALFGHKIGKIKSAAGWAVSVLASSKPWTMDQAGDQVRAWDASTTEAITWLRSLGQPSPAASAKPAAPAAPAAHPAAPARSTGLKKDGDHWTVVAPTDQA